MNQLAHLPDFQQVLANYQPSAQAVELLHKARLVLLVGPTSSGKNTILAELLKTNKYHGIVSDTTRKPRTNNGIMEQNGREYWFRTEEEMLSELRNGDFLEAAVIHNQQVSGINTRELKTAADQGKSALNEVDVVGATNIHRLKPDGLFLFIVPPSFDEWMVRMSSRGALPPEEIKRRLTSAVQELETALQAGFYHFAVNDTFMHTVKYIDALVEGELPDDPSQQAARAVAEEVLRDTKARLAA